MSVLTLLGRPRRGTSRRSRRANHALRYGFNQFDRLEERTLLSMITQSQSFGPADTSFTNSPLTPTINQFNTEGGILVLDSVEIKGSSSVTASLSGDIVNTSTTATESFTLTTSVTDVTTSFTGPGLGTGGVGSGTVSASQATLLSTSNSGTLAPGATFTVTPQSNTLPAGPVDIVLTSPAALAQFIGTGVLGPYTTSANDTTSDNFTGGGNIKNDTSFTSQGQASVEVIYTFHNVPSITTQAGGTVVVGSGNKLNDSATLTNASGAPFPVAGGSITFNLFPDGSTTPVYTDTVPVNGNGTYTTAMGNNPGGFLPTAAGLYQWVASYSGDANNTAVASPRGAEPETVSPASPTITTSQQPTTAVVGSPIADMATVHDGFNPTGTVTFQLFNNNTGSGTPLFTDTEPLASNGTATSKTTTTTATGTDFWVATYSGDNNNNPASSGVAAEPVTITPASPTITTSQQPPTAVVGSTIADMATVHDGFNPTGTVTFQLFNNPTGSGTPLFTDTEPLASNETATSKGFVTTAAGTDYWVATYNGDSNNNTATSGPAAEPVVITPSPTAISTAQTGTVAIGDGKMNDIATLSGGVNPTGTITFNLFPDGGATPVYTDVVNVTGNGSYSTATMGNNAGGFLPTVSGLYQWVATYSGDSNNSAAASARGSEPENAVNAFITIAPLTAVNEVNHAETFSVVVTAFPAATGAPSFGTPVVTVSPTPSSEVVSTPVVSGNTATFTITINNTSAGTFNVKAADTVTMDGVAVTRTTGDGFTSVEGSDSPSAVKHYVNADIAIAPQTAVNEVNHAEVFTVTVNAFPDTTGTPSFGPLMVNVSPTPSGGTMVSGATITGNTATWTVTINNNAAGSFVVQAKDVVTMGGVAVTRTTGDGFTSPDGNDSPSAVKHYVNADIAISPLTPVNEVKHAEVFTVTVNAFPDTTGAPSFGALSIVTTPVPDGGVTISPATITGNTATWQVTINSDKAGTFTVQASDVVTMGGVAVTRTTGDGFTSPDGSDSPSAVKNYVDALIAISPLTPVNPVGVAETFTVTITAFPAATGAPHFGTPTFSVTPTPSTETSTPLVVNGDVATFTITINSTVPGTFTVTAGDTVTMGGVAVVRNTGDNFTSGDGSDSPNAVKTYVPVTPALTWGFWKNHDGTGPQADAWPIGIFNIAPASSSGPAVVYHGVDVGGIAEGTFTVGGHTYSADDVRSIFGTSVRGNALINLGHQLFAAILNVANGAGTPTAVSEIKAASDLLASNHLVIGVDSVTAGDPLYAQLINLASELDAFNSSGS
jgi:hypothetical protein